MENLSNCQQKETVVSKWAESIGILYAPMIHPGRLFMYTNAVSWYRSIGLMVLLNTIIQPNPQLSNAPFFLANKWTFWMYLYRPT